LTTLYVGNLSPEATDSDLRSVFSVFGEIGSLRVARNRAGRPRVFAYVEMEEDAAAAAMEALKGSELKGRTMDVVVDQASSGGHHHKRDARRGGFRRRR
jgi:RNA recognition motif-containing protein